ncbi:MAG: PAS domain S-box protein [Deltaproteobacteria bacterium]|nr:PAS domain S-box protein [Deltaproteobacteria bacterium]
MSDKPLYNSMIVKTYLEYLEKDYPDLNFKELLSYAGITNYEIEDKGHWLTQQQVNLFHEYASRATNNPDVAKQAGRYMGSPKSSVSSILRQSVVGFLSPAMAYWAVEKIATNLSRHLSIKSKSLSDNKIEIIATPNPGVQEELFQCHNRLGMFEAVAEIFTGEFATVEHPECLHRGDWHCRYIISWRSPRSMIWRRIGYYLLALTVLSSFPLFYFLPTSHWLVTTLSALLTSTTVLLFGSFLRNREMAANLQQQGQATDELVAQINLRYNESLLIREIGEAVSSILDPQELLNFITDALHKRLLFDRSLVMLANPERTRLVFSSGHGYTPHEAALLRNLSFSLTNPQSKGFFYQAFVNQKPFLVDGVEHAEAHLSERSYKLIRDLGIKAFICVPIVFKGETEGILSVDISGTGSNPTQSDVSLLVGVAQQIGISLSNARTHKRVLESEERFRNLSDNSPDIIYQLDESGRFKYVNSAWEEIFGHSHAGLLGKCLADFLRQEDQKVFADVLQSILKDQLRVRDKYLTISNAKGLPRYITLSAAPDLDAEGKVIGLVGTIKDISTLRSMEAQLLQASKMEALGTLTGGIAHDFNNIIQAIMGYNQLMLSGRLGNEADMPYLNSIGELITRSRELVRQLLLFSKKVEPLSNAVDINKEIKSIHNLLSKSIPKMIEIRTDLCEDIFSIMADATQIGQVIMNLVINARDAMGESGTITITTRNLVLQERAAMGGTQVAPGTYVLLSVTDTGCGMDGELIKRIFEPFFTTKGPGKGTGLGLSVVQGIIKNHDGFIHCESQPDKGTTFDIILPAKAKGGEAKKDQDLPKLNAYGTETILLVDDEKNILETVEDTLKLFGYRVITAESGEEAVKIYARLKDSIDLVILDLIMPGGGGKKCLHDLRSIKPDVRVLMTSGFASGQQTEDLTLAGAAGFIHKPYRPEDLLGTIRKIIDGNTHSGTDPLQSSKGV